MATKKTSKKKVDANRKTKLQAGDIKALWHKVPASRWAALFNEVDHAGNWRADGNTVLGLCPYHDDKHPSMSLNFGKGIGKCFSCGHVVVDLINFFAKLGKQSYTGALTDLSAKIDLQGIIGDGVNDLAELNLLQEMKKAAAMAFREIISEYLRDKPGHLKYLEPGIRYLVKGRGVDANLLSGMLPIGLFGKPEHVKKHIKNQDLHPLYDEYFKDINRAEAYGSVIFHFNDRPGSISQFKVRLVACVKGGFNAFEECEKASMDEMSQEACRSLVSKEFHIVKDKFAEGIGIFGLNFYNRMIGSNVSDAYLTEGEFDALSVMVAQERLGRTDFIVFATGGTGNKCVSSLRELGIRTVWIVQDAPCKKGNVFAQQFLQDPSNYIGDSGNKRLMYKVFRWPAGVRGSDLDEAIQQMGYETMAQYLAVKRADTFQNSYVWITGMCDGDVDFHKRKMEADLANADSETAKENIRDAAKHTLLEVISNWFRCVANDKLNAPEFITRYIEREKIDISVDPSVRGLMYNRDSDNSVEIIADALGKYIDVAYYESVKNNLPKYYLWGKHTRDVFLLPTQEKLIRNVLSTNIGSDVYDWIEMVVTTDKLYTKNKDDTISADIAKRNMAASRLIDEAIAKMEPTAPNIDDTIKVGQGIHYADIKGHGKKDADVVYFINGEKVFKGTYTKDSAVPLEWEFINKIVDDRYIFVLNKKEKWSCVNDVSELYASTEIDVRALYEDICKILDGWTFEDHDFTKKYLAAWILSLPIQRAINQVNIVFITGASSSGKTSLVRGILGGTSGTSATSNFEVPTIIEGSWFSSDATSASIYQTLDESALTLCLDEAESNSNSQHSRRVQSIFDMLYQLSFGGTKTSRGGSTLDQKVNYNLMVPVVLAAIDIESNPVFLSRIIPIYTVQDTAHKNISAYINENFTIEQISKIRKSVTLCMLDKIPRLISQIPSLRKRMAEAKTVVKASDRFITIQLPIMTVLEYIGEDAVSMFQRMVYNRRTMLENLNSQDFQSELLNIVLYANAYETTFDDTHQRTYAAKLILNEEYGYLNNSDKGIYVIPERQWIIIYWKVVKQCMLLFNHVYGNKSENQLRESVSKNRYVINISPEDHEFIRDRFGRTDIKNSSAYTVISLEYIHDPDVKAQGEKMAAEAAKASNANVGPSESMREDVIGSGFSL